MGKRSSSSSSHASVPEGHSKPGEGATAVAARELPDWSDKKDAKGDYDQHDDRGGAAPRARSRSPKGKSKGMRGWSDSESDEDGKYQLKSIISIQGVTSSFRKKPGEVASAAGSQAAFLEDRKKKEKVASKDKGKPKKEEAKKASDKVTPKKSDGKGEKESDRKKIADRGGDKKEAKGKDGDREKDRKGDRDRDDRDKKEAKGKDDRKDSKRDDKRKDRSRSKDRRDDRKGDRRDDRKEKDRRAKSRSRSRRRR